MTLVHSKCNESYGSPARRFANRRSIQNIRDWQKETLERLFHVLRNSAPELPFSGDNPALKSHLLFTTQPGRTIIAYDIDRPFPYRWWGNLNKSVLIHCNTSASICVRQV